MAFGDPGIALPYGSVQEIKHCFNIEDNDPDPVKPNITWFMQERCGSWNYGKWQKAPKGLAAGTIM